MTRVARYLPVSAGAALIAMLASGVAQADPLDCNTLDANALGVAEVTIASSEAVPAGGDAPVGHCLIRGSTQQRTGLDGSSYAIDFELRLPSDWNGRFVHQFNGGNDGAVVPAFGPLLSGNQGDTALSRNYAVVSSNAGHAGDANPDAALAGGARFGFDPEARKNYGYGAVEVLQPLAERMVEAYYGAEIAYSYGVGGSNGGRHAMVAASRLPDSFDGLLVGYPGFNLPKAAIQHAWDVQAFLSVSDTVAEAFSREDLALVSSSILAACDGLDELEDGLINDVDACQSAFDIGSLSCAAGSTNQCLTPEQVSALTKIHAGPSNSKGEQLYSPWVWDSGIASGDWRFWKLESGIPPWGNGSLIMVMGSSSLAQIFMTPPTEVDGSPEALLDYLRNFDFDTDAPKIFASDATFTESAMEFMTPPGADDPELAELREAGGKMIVFHGVSDPVFSVVDTTEWYRRLDANNADAAEDFVRYYRVPGMAHGANGPATTDYDFFSALVAWVENGSAPEAVVAGVVPENEEAMAALGAIERPLCPYPQVAGYVDGDAASAESFACR